MWYKVVIFNKNDVCINVLNFLFMKSYISFGKNALEKNSMQFFLMNICSLVPFYVRIHQDIFLLSFQLETTFVTKTS